GKTFAIAALATRAIAEGRATLPELLIVTFTRAATAELGDRVRRRLVEAAGHLEARLAGTAAASDDPVLLALERGADDAELRRRTDRLSAAVTSFDAATITTIHSFCQQALRGVGLSAEDADAALIEDQSELIEQVVSDTLVARFHDTGGAPPHREVVAAVRAVVDPGLVVLTGGIGAATDIAERVAEVAGELCDHELEVVRSELGDRASLVGAGVLALGLVPGWVERGPSTTAV
ncbi:MAG: UvrD-helicase domain-containing protein, partial [Actinomycetota bacterium]